MKKFDAKDREIIAVAGEFARSEVAPNAVVWERQRRIGLEHIKQAAELGLTGMQIPSANGGLGLGFACKARVLELLAREDFGFAMSLVNTHNVALKLTSIAPARIINEYLPPLLSAEKLGCTALTEPGAGSDVGAITTTATRVGDGWELNGEKAWITNAALAEVIIVYAQTEPGIGTKGIAAFLVDACREGFERTQQYDLAGQNSIGTGGFILKNYLASDDEMLLPPRQAFKEVMAEINGARTYVSAMCCGMVAKAIELCTQYGQKRETFGKPLIARQGWRWPLAEADTDLVAARLLVEKASNHIEDGADARLVSAQAKIFATRMAERHLPSLMQLMGAEGLREQYPLGRHLIGARIAGYVDGSTEMLLELVAALIAKR